MKLVRGLVVIALAAAAVPSALCFTKWGMGPNVVELLAGHEMTPGFATWSMMGGGKPIAGFPGFEDAHTGLLTADMGMMLGTPGMGEEFAAISAAFATWSAVAHIGAAPVMDSGAPGGGLEAMGSHIGDIRFALIGGFSSSTVLAHAFAPGTEAFHGIGGTIGGDLHFNAAKTWVDDPFDLDDGALYDMQTVALHEIGHALGLSHSSVPGSVMFATYEGGKRSLTPDDIAAISHFYGAVPEPATIAVLSLGLAVLVRRRRK